MGDVVAQSVERRPRDLMDSMTGGSNPVRSTRNMCASCSESKNGVLTPMSVCLTPPTVDGLLVALSSVSGNNCSLFTSPCFSPVLTLGSYKMQLFRNDGLWVRVLRVEWRSQVDSL